MTHAVSYVKHLWSCLCVRDDVCAEEIELKAANWQAMLRRVGYRNVYRRERIPNDLVIRVRRHVRVCVRHVVLSLSLSLLRSRVSQLGVSRSSPPPPPPSRLLAREEERGGETMSTWSA